MSLECSLPAKIACSIEQLKKVIIKVFEKELLRNKTLTKDKTGQLTMTKNKKPVDLGSYIKTDDNAKGGLTKRQMQMEKSGRPVYGPGGKWVYDVKGGYDLVVDMSIPGLYDYGDIGARRNPDGTWTFDLDTHGLELMDDQKLMQEATKESGMVTAEDVAQEQGGVFQRLNENVSIISFEDDPYGEADPFGASSDIKQQLRI